MFNVETLNGEKEVEFERVLMATKDDLNQDFLEEQKQYRELKKHHNEFLLDFTK